MPGYPEATADCIGNDTAITARVKLPTGVTAFPKDTLDAKAALAVCVSVDDDLLQLSTALKLALMVAHDTGWARGPARWSGWYGFSTLNPRVMVLVGDMSRDLPEDGLLYLPFEDAHRVRLKPIDNNEIDTDSVRSAQAKLNDLPAPIDCERMAGLVRDWFESIRPEYPAESDGVSLNRDGLPDKHEWRLEIVVDPESVLHQHLGGCVLLRACWVRYD